MARLQLDINFFDPETIKDPYPYYEQVRDVGPVVWNDYMQGWMVTGFEDCGRILADTGATFAMVSDTEILPWFEDSNMIMVDDDAHQRLRAAVAPLFTRRAVARWEARVAEVVDELLAPLVGGGRKFDLIAGDDKGPEFQPEESRALTVAGAQNLDPAIKRSRA